MMLKAPTNEKQAGLIDAPRLLEILVPHPACRPSVRWLRTQVASRTLPFVRIGRLCFFDAQIVKAYLDGKATAKGGK